MSSPTQPPSEQRLSGATVPDLILRVLGSPFLVLPLFLVVLGLLGSIALGYIELSWSDSGLKLTQGQPNADAADINIAGTWTGVGKDLSDSDHRIVAKYSYTLSLTFTQKASTVQMHGSYFIKEDNTLPQRSISGHGDIRGDYLYLLYDIQVGSPSQAKTHGFMLLQIQPSSRKATGYYLNRSMANDGFVFGGLHFTR